MVPAVIIVAIIVITTGGSGHAPARIPPARLPPLRGTYASRAIGVSGAVPGGWTAIAGPGFVRLARKDHKATIVIVSQAVAPGTKPPLLKPAVDAIHNAYHSVTIKHAPGTRLGGVPARSVVIYTRNANHVPIRILVAAAQGHRRAWVLETFTAQKAPQRALVEAEQVVLALHLKG